MFLSISLIEGFFLSVIVLVVLIGVVAGIGWAGYIKVSAENKKLRFEKNNIQHLLNQYRVRENIRIANEYNKEEQKNA